MTWHSVKDILPNHERSIIVRDENKIKHVAYYEPDGTWKFSFCCGCEANNITHWCEIPEFILTANNEQGI